MAGLAIDCLGVAAGLLEFLVALAGLAGASSSELSESELSEELSAAFFAGAALVAAFGTTALAGVSFLPQNLNQTRRCCPHCSPQAPASLQLSWEPGFPGASWVTELKVGELNYKYLVFSSLVFLLFFLFLLTGGVLTAGTLLGRSSSCFHWGLDHNLLLGTVFLETAAAFSSSESSSLLLLLLLLLLAALPLATLGAARAGVPVLAGTLA